MQVELITVEMENVIRNGLACFADVYIDIAGTEGDGGTADCILKEIERVTRMGYSNQPDQDVLSTLSGMLNEGMATMFLGDEMELIERLDINQKPYILEIKRNGNRIGYIPSSQVQY